MPPRPDVDYIGLHDLLDSCLLSLGGRARRQATLPLTFRLCWRGVGSRLDFPEARGAALTKGAKFPEAKLFHRRPLPLGVTLGLGLASLTFALAQHVLLGFPAFLGADETKRLAVFCQGGAGHLLCGPL